MYTGNHTNVTAKLHEIQNKGRTRAARWTTSHFP